MNTLDMGLAAAARASQVATTTAPQRYAKVAALAESASLRLAWQARRDVLVVALQRLVQDLYEKTGGGVWVNVATDGMVIMVTPMSKHTCSRWGMRRSDADLLRALLCAEERMHAKAAAPMPLLTFDDSRRRWFLNLSTYPLYADGALYVERLAGRWTWETLVKATEWLEKHSPTGQKRGPAGGRLRAKG